MRIHQDLLLLPPQDPHPDPHQHPGVDFRTAQTYSVNITLDPDTAHPWLVLSKDLKQVYNNHVWKPVEDLPQRFSCVPCVLGQQVFSSGRFYFEIQVQGKSTWDLGVALRCGRRKGRFFACPENGFWRIILRNGYEYVACSNPPVPLRLKTRPDRVGVYVDYDRGLVQFYDADSEDLIHGFTDCRFNDGLVPYLGPYLNQSGTNSEPMVICEVDHSPELDR